MKNVKKTVGTGFKPDKSIFGVSINNYSAWAFIKPDSNEIRVALVNDLKDTVCNDERVYFFNNVEEFKNWKDEIHNSGGYYAHFGDANLLARAYPVFYRRDEENDFFDD